MLLAWQNEWQPAQLTKWQWLEVPPDLRMDGSYQTKFISQNWNKLQLGVFKPVVENCYINTAISDPFLQRRSTSFSDDEAGIRPAEPESVSKKRNDRLANFRGNS